MTPLAYLIQRLSAVVMVPLVLTHLALIIYAIRGGVSADEILGRTQGSIGWALFYGLFVLSVSVHAGFGLRNILDEWTKLGRGATAALAHGFMALSLVVGMRAVVAVVGS